MEIIDRTNDRYENGVPEHGDLWVKRDPDQQFIPSFAKDGDVGLDLPVKINIDTTKFGIEPDKLRSALVSPDVRELIKPDGTKEDPFPHMFIPPHGWAEIPTGLSIKLPDDAWGMIKTRSSTAWKKHLEVSIGTIDPGYVGLLGTLVHNPNSDFVKVREFDPVTKRGDCLSQLILIPRYPLGRIILTQELPATKRGKTGFGSTSL